MCVIHIIKVMVEYLPAGADRRWMVYGGEKVDPLYVIHTFLEVYICVQQAEAQGISTC